MAQSYTRRIQLWINGAQVRNDIKSIQARMMHLQKTIKTLEIGSRQYNQEMARIRHLNAIIAQHNAQLRTTQFHLTSFKGLTATFNRLFASLMAGIGMLTGLAFATRRAATDFADFDDMIANVMKVTGLTRDQVIALNRALQKIDTRTAQESLIELAWVAGKLGISAEEDIIGFVRAADQISVALAKDLGGSAEEAIRMIGKMAEVFEVRDVYGIEEAMLRLGSSINELGMASTAQEGFLIQFASRVAGIAPTAGVSAQNVLGLAATLDILGQKAEVSATAYSRVMTTMSRDTETMARLSGMSIAEYQKLFKEDANEAMIRLFESIARTEGGFPALVEALGEAGLEGQRLTQVLGVLIRNTETLREQQELSNRAFEEGVSITNEFNIKNNTAQAILEKKQKALGILRRELGERLLPVYMGALTYQERFMKSMATTVEWIFEYRRALLAIIATIITYRTVLSVLNKVKTTQIILGRSLTAVNLQLVRGYNLLTGNITRAAAAQRLFNKLQLTTPWTAIIAGIAAAGVAIWQYARTVRSSINTVEEAYQKADKEYAEQAANIKRLVGIIEDERLANEQRAEAIKDLKKIMPEYNGMLSKEGELLEHNTKMIESYLAQLRMKIRAKAIEDQFVDEFKREFEAEERLTEAQRKRAKAQEDYHRAIERNLDSRAIMGYFTALNAARRDEERAIRNLDQIRARIKELKDTRVGSQEPGLFVPTEGTGIVSGGIVSRGFTEREEMFAKQALQQEFLQGKLLRGYEEYQEKFKEIELRFMRGRHAQMDKDGEGWLKLRGEIYDREIDLLRQKITDEEELQKTAAMNDPIEAESLAYQQRLKDRGLFYKEFADMTETEQAAALALQQDYQARLDKIDADAIKNHIDSKQKAHEANLAAMRIGHQKQLEEITSFEQAKEILAQYLDENQLQRIRTLYQAKKSLAEEQSKIEQQVMLDHLDEMVLMLETLLETGQWDSIILADNIFSDEEKQIVLDRLRRVYDELLKLRGEDPESDEAQKLRRLDMDIFGFTQEDWNRMFDNIEKGVAGVNEIQMAMLALGNAWYDVNRIISNSEQRRLAEFQKNNEQQKDWLQQRFDAGLISHENFIKHQGRLEEDLDKQRAITARNQARRERSVALMQAIVNTAAGVTKALASANVALAAIIGVAGALQIGIIASTPLPQIPGAETGGHINIVRSQDQKKFRGRYQPGKRGWITQPTVITGESGYEYVIPDEGVKNPKLRPIINMIEMARVNGNLPTLDPDVPGLFERSLPGRQRGGTISRDVSPISHNPGVNDRPLIELLTKALNRSNDIAERNESILKKVSDQLKAPIRAEVSLLGRDGLLAKEDELKRAKRNAYN